MNRDMLHGAPRPGQAGPRPHSQDARANLAVQPGAGPKISLKKASVKVVRPVAATPTAPPAAPSAQPVKSMPKAEDGYGTSFKGNPPPAIKLEPEDTPTKPVWSSPNPASSFDAESDLDSLFARLNSAHSGGAAPNKAVASEQKPPTASEEKFTFTFGGQPAKPEEKVTFTFGEQPAKPQETARQSFPPASPITPVRVAQQHKEDEEAKVQSRDTPKKAEELDENLQRKYFDKVFEYLVALPTTETSAMIKDVATKLRSSYTQGPKPELKTPQGLDSQCVDAIAAYCNGLRKPGVKLVTKQFIEETLAKSGGDFLWLCALLVDENVLALDNLTEVVGLCKAVSALLPDHVSQKTASLPQAKVSSSDPVNNMTAWPTQEKRDAVEGRTCILKGVSAFTSINQLQALVWGGRLESIAMPESGSSYALVKFLTADGCSKYFDDTVNGIEVPGAKKTIIFVGKQPGPNSVNDVIRNCVEGDVTRCVRALDAEDDWNDMILLRLAKGKGKAKREVDRIKRGKTSTGRYYIEFRFSSVYHALNFKRALTEDTDWEACTISYAPDPCEIAKGVHLVDEDEDETKTGFFS